MHNHEGQGSERGSGQGYRKLPEYSFGKDQRHEGVKGVTLFVENIPRRMQWRGLWHIQVDANRAMERLNGFSTYGFRLTVKVAREENMKKAVERKHPINEQVRDHRQGEKEEISQRADGQTQKDFITRQTCCKKVLGHVEE
ncbi:hypothetical protein V6N13_018577 [Hibiscus sabdariffa]